VGERFFFAALRRNLFFSCSVFTILSQRTETAFNLHSNSGAYLFGMPNFYMEIFSRNIFIEEQY